MTKKPRYSTDWMDKVKSKKEAVDPAPIIDVIKSEDLPKLMSSSEAAQLLNCHVKTLERYRREGAIKFISRRGRYFYTLKNIIDFTAHEALKNG